MVSSVSRDNFNIITVVLGADTKKIRTTDSVSLIEYTYKNYELVDINSIIQKEFENWQSENMSKVYINKGLQNEVKLKLAISKYNKYPLKSSDNTEVKINVIKNIEAPAIENTVVGGLEVIINGTKIENIDVVIKETVQKKGIINYFSDIFKNYGIILEELVT